MARTGTLPLIERAWRTWRRLYQPLHVAAQADRQSFVARLRELAATDYDTLRPLLAGTPIPSQQAALAMLTQPRRPESALLPFGVAAYSAYREHKRVYRVHPTLAQGLVRAAWPGRYPVAAVTLPLNGTVLELPETVDTEAATVICHVEPMGTRDDGVVRTLVVTEIPSDDPIGCIPGLRLLLPLRPDVTLNGALAAVSEEIGHHVTSPGRQAAVRDQLVNERPLVRLVVNTLLYIQGDDDVVADVHPGKNPHRPIRRGPLGDIPTDLAVPETAQIGARYAAAIERWEIAHPETSVPGDGENARTVRPHVRAAHAHLYWTGEGRTEPRVHFLPPIPVHGGAESSRLTVRPVR